jgi:hypothetical protein
LDGRITEILLSAKAFYMSTHKKQEHHLRSYKIAAQSIGALVSLFFMLVIAGKAMPKNYNEENQELIPLLLYIMIPIGGYVITWFKEMAGAIMLLAGGIFLMVYFLAKGEIGSSFFYGIPFIIAGTLYLIHLKKRNDLKNN